MPKKKDQNEFDQVYAMLKKTELYAMADQLKRLEDENQLYEMSTLEVISSIVNEELISKTNKRASYLKDRAHMYMAQADLNDVYYDMERHLNQPLINQLASSQYIKDGRNIMISAATGCGKTFLACAFGNRACEHGYSVKYYQMSDLLFDYRAEKLKNTDIRKFIRKIANVDLFIIDDFMLTSVTVDEAEFLYKLISYKRPKNRKRTYILCSQLMKEEIYKRMMECSPSLADSVMDRIVHGTYQIKIDGDSMRARQVKPDTLDSSLSAQN